MLSQSAILEFQAIYQKKFNEQISFEKAKEEAMRLLKVFKLIYRPLEIKKDKK